MLLCFWDIGFRNTKPTPDQEHPDRIQIAFDDHRLVANAGLLLPVTFAQHLGLCELVDNHVDLGDAPGRANPEDKMLTLAASTLARSDCIDDADVLRTGGMSGAILAGKSCAISPIIAHRKASEQASGPAVDQLRQGNIFRLLKLEHAIFRHPPKQAA